MMSMKPLFWILVLLILLLYLVGLLCTIAMKDHIDNDPGVWMEQHDIFKAYSADMYFGTIPRSMFTLFNLVLMAEYPEFVRPIFFLDPALVGIFVVFVFFTVFGVLNVLVGLIVDNMFQ